MNYKILAGKSTSTRKTGGLILTLKGSFVFTASGQRLLDFSSGIGVVNTGTSGK